MSPLHFSQCSSPDNLFIARREGENKTPGAILVLNNNDTLELSGQVDTKIDGFKNWAGEKLVNLLNLKDEVSVSGSGFVELKAPPRGISIYVPVNKHDEPN